MRSIEKLSGVNIQDPTATPHFTVNESVDVLNDTNELQPSFQNN
jgi:hypothetical protein